MPILYERYNYADSGTLQKLHTQWRVVCEWDDLDRLKELQNQKSMNRKIKNWEYKIE